MLIFDRFQKPKNAERFARAATETSGLPSVVCRDYKEFDRHEVFPFELSFPVALVERADLCDEGFRAEENLIRMVSFFGGRFAGT